MVAYDVIVIGAGIVGLATALQLLKGKPDLKVAIVEKADRIAAHQSGHNSGVIHTGIYYKPGSLKAKNCVQGVQELLNFCEEHKIPIERCGKVIVATHEAELPRLVELANRGKANGVQGLEMIGPEKLKELEPAASCIQALHSPNTAIINFIDVAKKYAEVIASLGGALYLSTAITGIKARHNGILQLQTSSQELFANVVINCGGIRADEIAHMHDRTVLPHQLLPFRGEYYELVPEKRSLINGLIYPVPDPKFPFLGVHLSKKYDGSVEAGPNAVLAWSKDGYRKRDISLKDCMGYLRYRGFWSMALKYWDIGLYELYRSYSKKAFLKALQRLVPSLTEEDIVPGRSGVRAQLVGQDGKMHDDFAIVESDRVIHVLNAPSPAATASLAIGAQLARRPYRYFSGV